MTTEQLISKAIHCLNTGQPNLAKLYMQKGAATIREQRRRTATEMSELLYGSFRQRAILGIKLTAESLATQSAIPRADYIASLEARLPIAPAPLLAAAQ